ncbi:hypothetical protein P0F65_11450 [Sphingomonas sp. I4]
MMRGWGLAVVAGLAMLSPGEASAKDVAGYLAAGEGSIWRSSCQGHPRPDRRAPWPMHAPFATAGRCAAWRGGSRRPRTCRATWARASPMRWAFVPTGANCR